MSEKQNSTPVCIQDYDVVGFDIDHTLAKYNMPSLYNLVHDTFTKTLVEEHGYDASLAEPFDQNKDLWCVGSKYRHTRGLVVDIARGNIFKVGKDGIILRANHGSKPMSDAEVQAAYGPKKLFEHYQRFLETADNVKEDGGLRYFLFDNFYDSLITVVIARMVDQLDKKIASKNLSHLRSDFLRTRNRLLFDKALTEKAGFFTAIRESPEKYIERLPEKVTNWIKKLRREGKKLFLMTSSYVDFASFTMNHVFGSDWLDHFDAVLTYTKKPSFFHSNNYFLRLEGNSEKEPVMELEKGQIYSQGNLTTFNKLLTKLTGKDEPRVLYFGDSLRSDIVPAKKYAEWDTVFIYEEMEAEMAPARKPRAASESNKNGDEGGEPVRKKLKTNGSLIVDEKSTYTSSEREYLSSVTWGSFLVDDMNSSKLRATMYGELMRKHTDLAIAQISHIADLPLDHKFGRVTEEDVSVSGFYPRPPEILRNCSVAKEIHRANAEPSSLT